MWCTAWHHTLFMKKFIVWYPIYLSLLLYLLFLDTNIISQSFNNFQRDTLLQMLSFWFENRVVHHYVMITKSYFITIDRACNGAVILLIFVASILAYRTKLMYKLLWLMIGYIVLSVANFMRIVFVIYMVLQDPNYFRWAHDYVGNGFLIALGFGLFFIFIRLSPSNENLSTT